MRNRPYPHEIPSFLAEARNDYGHRVFCKDTLRGVSALPRHKAIVIPNVETLPRRVSSEGISTSTNHTFLTKPYPMKGFVLRFTGLSGAGKTTLSDALYKRLQDMNIDRIQQLDGDLVREHITKDLGFSKEDREENIRRITFVAGLLSKHGVGVLATFVSPYILMRDQVRKGTTNFIEVYVNAPLSVCEDRDVKGLYAKARTGEIKNFTGISDPYEAPESPEIEVRTDLCSIDEGVDQVIAYLSAHKYL